MFHFHAPTASGVSDSVAPGDHEKTTPLLHLQKAIENAAHLLPAQGPITVFIHHNTLHAWEDLPFTEAVKQAAKVLGGQPYLSEERYRTELNRGRIRMTDLQRVLQEDLGVRGEQRIARVTTHGELRMAMLQYPLRSGPTAELLWFVAETDALRRVRSDVSAVMRSQLIAETRRWVMRDLRGGSDLPENGQRCARRTWVSAEANLTDLLERFGEAAIESWSEANWEAFTLQALWRICCCGAAAIPPAETVPSWPIRHRDLLLQVTGEDTDLLVHDVLIRFCAAFLDQGLARWPLPRREEGFFRAFAALYKQPAILAEPWLHGLAGELQRLQNEHVSPLASIRESLDLLGVVEAEQESYLAATLLALRGWAGMLHFLEHHPDRAVQSVPPGSLIEFLAVRLLLDRLALVYTARQVLGRTGSLHSLRQELRRLGGQPRLASVEQRAFAVFQLAQVLGWTPEKLSQLQADEWASLLQAIEEFTPLERQRIFHRAYEHRLYIQTLDALVVHNRAPCTEPATPRFQALFCIDEREESLRRHLEEVAPESVTYGIAGFYFVPMYYRGITDAHFVPLCPVVMKPQHWVTEKALDHLADAHEQQRWTRQVLGKATHQLHVGSRTFVLGALLSAMLGVLASIPLIARTLFPRLTARIRRELGRFVLASPPTRLHLERSDPKPGPEPGQIGFSLDEMVIMAERVLRDIGLTASFARLVFIFGHGSSSMNNPHESAHDCGACGGSRGGPNGRAIAQILNDPRVRERLRARGLRIPAETIFVGGQHDTSTEAITFYDLDLLPASHRAEFTQVHVLLTQAVERNAHERCRRFDSAPLTLSFTAARQHVEARAEDLAQVRPEMGHATNAICIVGRRQRTRGLFLDRRAFLNSYDPTQDDADATILTRILQAVMPVCAGINLEYYFSRVDNANYGCGTKLPHNIAALVGVMDGAASDLRTGLPWQMVDIHEPVRILFVIETTPDIMSRILERQPVISRLVRNSWVQLAVLDPQSPTLWTYRDGDFHLYMPEADHLPQVPSSVHWYRGWRDHLEFARISCYSSSADSVQARGEEAT